MKEGHTSLKSKRLKAEISKKGDQSLIERLAQKGYKTPSSIIDEDLKKLVKITGTDKKKIQKLKEVLMQQKNKDIPFPGWKALDAERNESKPEIVLLIKNKSDEIIAQLSCPLTKGFSRVNWSLNTIEPTVSNTNSKYNYYDVYQMAKPGSYTVSMYKRIEGELTPLSKAQPFEIERIRKNTLINPMAEKHEAYYKSIVELTKKVKTLEHHVNKPTKESIPMKKTET